MEVGGQRLAVSNLDKVLYPQTGFTKAQVIDYYMRISAALLPHLRDRPITLKRYPEGVEGEYFYEKRCPAYRPKWVRVAPVRSPGQDKTVSYCLLNDVRSLVWAANLADLELHTSLARYPKVDSPTILAFDLDPGPPANILSCAQVSFWLKAALDEIALESLPKTSGSKGLQIYVPLNTPARYEVTKNLAHELARRIEQAHPEAVLSRMAKSERVGKVFIDWSQNDRHKTTVCVYSLRATAEPRVSTPVTWEELAAALKKKDPARLAFTPDEVLERVEKEGDLFAPILKIKQRPPKLEVAA